MSSFPLTFIFSKMVETTNPYMFISHPQTYDDPQVQLPPCHSLGPTKGAAAVRAVVILLNAILVLVSMLVV